MRPAFVTFILLTVLIMLAALLVIGQANWRDPWFLFRRRPRNVLAWLLTGLVGLSYLDAAWNSTGHVTCDFASQWLIGRMFFTGRAHELYLVGPEKEVLSQGYHDQDWTKMVRDILRKGRSEIADDEVEGPLYPPTHGLVMMPFSMLEPRAAHAVLTLIYVQLVFLCGFLIRDITQGRIQAGEAALICMVFPNFAGGIVLGQNSSLTLTIATAGWWFWSRGRPWLAGLVWGLLAYKPVFAVALLWVPVMLLSGRFLAGMITSGMGFVAATLPFTGLAAWLRWFEVGRHAAELYERDANWVWMSRDLISLPRRQLWDWDHFWPHVELITAQREFDFDTLQQVQNGPWLTALGLALWLGVILSTIGLVALIHRVDRSRGRFGFQKVFGPRPAFLLFGALLTTYHFMHYDLQPMALPMCLLLAHLDRMSRFAQGLLISVNLALVYCHMDLSMGHGSVRIPFETLLLLCVWAWSGILALREALSAGSLASVGEGCQVSPSDDGSSPPEVLAGSGTFSSCSTSERQNGQND
ncbi:MAG: DUF2029 domain-containing protein [Gemmatales bacterium]|nr:DUF2029 domain-containing protein [Gemmatales bacterium]MDW8387478.1 glycosyltransferase family 87 protein [Gemmatales bacterium]